MATSEQPAPMSDINKSLLLVITMIANFFNPFTGSSVNIALPQIAGELKLNAVMMSWVTMSYLLSSAVFLVPMGKMADRLGRMKIFLIGNIIFMLASFACIFAHTAGLLILFRFIQGFGGSMMVSTSMAILMSAFPPSERGKVIGFNVASVYLGLSAAPVLGGIITQAWGWRTLFLINGMAASLIVLVRFFYLRSDWKEAEKRPFDWKGVYWYVPSMLLLMYGISKLPLVYAACLILAGLIGLMLFIRQETRTTCPILEIALFRHNRVFGLSNLSAFINYAATYAVTFILSLYLQYVRHLSPREAGILLVAQPVLMALVSLFSGRLSDRMPPHWLASGGMAISVTGLAMMAFLTPVSSNGYLLSALAILGVGFGLFSSPNTNMVMSAVEQRYYGVASATIATMRNMGMMFSMAMATMSVHLFIGNRILGDTTIPAFMSGLKLIFLLFSFFCLLGVYSSSQNTQTQKGRRSISRID